MQKLTVSAAESGQRLDKYIKRKLPEAGSSFVYKMLRKKNITLNGKKAEGNEMIDSGDEVQFFLSDETYQKFGGRIGASAPAGQGMVGMKNGMNSGTAGGANGAAGNGSAQTAASNREDPASLPYLQAYEQIRKAYSRLKIVYEDDDLLMADKPAGVLSQKTKPDDYSLNEWFVGYLLDTGKISADSMREFTPSVCNRLDRNTAGLVICAKSLRGSRVIAKLLRERTLHKYYGMIVCGRIDETILPIDITVFLKKNTETNTVKILAKEEPGCVPAMTRIVSARYRKENDLSFICAELITGKTHQLRASLAWYGHPILGDPKYGKESVNGQFREAGVKNQLLYCYKVEFPADLKELPSLAGKTIETKLPAIYSKLV